MSNRQIVDRKEDHLRIVMEEDVEHHRSTMLEDIQLLHQALCELDFSAVETSTGFFGKTLRAPFMITSMTGGTEHAGKLNRTLAEAAAERGIAFAVGSQRVLLLHPEYQRDFAVRPIIGDGVLLGNIGAMQLKEYPPETIAGLMRGIEADGMCVHLNPAQELVHGERGQQEFSGMLDRIAVLLDHLDGRLLIKETGAGLSPETLARLASIGVPYLDVSGSGGTSWTRVEMHRAETEGRVRRGKKFSEWGVPTAFSTIAARRICGEKTVIISSGGIRDGLDAARAIAAGANLAGFARPVLRAYLDGGLERVLSWLEDVEDDLRSAMFLCGAGTVDELRHAPRVYTGRLYEWLSAYGWHRGVKE